MSSDPGKNFLLVGKGVRMGEGGQRGQIQLVHSVLVYGTPLICTINPCQWDKECSSVIEYFPSVHRLRVQTTALKIKVSIKKS
jgi:hypothetical protein